LSVSAGARMVGIYNVLRLYARIDVLTNGDNLERTRQSAVYIDEGMHVTRINHTWISMLKVPRYLPCFSLQHAQTPT
jgi:hypothetical protein